MITYWLYIKLAVCKKRCYLPTLIHIKKNFAFVSKQPEAVFQVTLLTSGKFFSNNICIKFILPQNTCLVHCKRWLKSLYYKRKLSFVLLYNKALNFNLILLISNYLLKFELLWNNGLKAAVKNVEDQTKKNCRFH